MHARLFAVVMSALAVTIQSPGLYALESVPPKEAPVATPPEDAKIPVPPQPKPADNQVLEFADGSRLHGRIVKLGADELTWQRNDIAEPLLFSLRDVRQVTFRAPAKAQEMKSNATLQLKGGGWIVGDVSSFENDNFRMKLDAVPELTLGRDKVAWLFLSPATSPDAFDSQGGSMGISGWSFGGGAWESTEAGLLARGLPSPIRRAFEFLPDKVDIEFTAGDTGHPTGGVLTLMIATGADPGNSPSGHVNLGIQPGNISANAFDGRTSKNFQGSIPGEKNVPKLSRYRILQDRRSGKLLVFVDGKKVADWTVPVNKNIPPGGSLTFQPQSWGGESAWTIAKLRVRPWDGNAEPDAKPAEEGKDLLSTDAAGRQAGILEGISQDAVQFGGKEFARKEALFIRLGGADAAAPGKVTGTRVRLARRGEFDAAAVEIQEGRITVRTSFAGEITLPLESIRSIEFPPGRTVEELAATGAGDRLVFKNGDILRGSALSAGTDGPMKWRPAKGGVVEIGVGGVAGVLLARSVVPPGAGVSAVARLRNGDWITGALSGLDGRQLHFKLPLVGALQMDRTNVGSLYFGAGAAVPVWDGVADRDRWMRDAGGFASNVPGTLTRWRYLDGAFGMQDIGQNQWNNGGNQMFGRSLAALPEKVEASFEVSAKSGQMSFQLQLFSDPMQGGGFQIQCNGDQLWVIDNSPQRGGGFMRQPIQITLEKFDDPNKPRRFRLIADRKTGQLAVFVNGKLVGEFLRKAGKASPKRGRVIGIMAQAPVTISNLWIAPWVGPFPQMAKSKVALSANQAAAPSGDEPKPAEPEQPSPDVVLLVNGDETACTVEGATPEELRVKCEGDDLEFPLNRAMMVEFAGKSVAPVPGIRLRLAGGGLLTVQSFKLADGTVSCRHSLLGDLSFPVSALSEFCLQPRASVLSVGVPPDDIRPVKRPPAPPLEKARVDFAGFGSPALREYDYIQTINGEDAVTGRFTMKTVVEKDSLTLEDEVLNTKGGGLSLARKTTAGRNATLRMKRMFSANSFNRGGQSQQTVSVADNKATVNWEGVAGGAGRVQILDYPPNTATLFSLMRIVTALPGDAGGEWSVDRVFSEFEMRIRQQETYRLECRGKETVVRDDSKQTWTHFTLRSDRNPEDVAAEFFLDDRNVLQRAEFGGNITLRLRPEE